MQWRTVSCTAECEETLDFVIVNFVALAISSYLVKLCNILPHCFVIYLLITFRVNDDTLMLTPGWTEAYIDGLQVSLHFVFHNHYVQLCYMNDIVHCVTVGIPLLFWYCVRKCR